MDLIVTTFIHHPLTDLGMTHIRATAALISFNVVVVAIVLGFQKVRSEIVLSAVLPPQSKQS